MEQVSNEIEWNVQGMTCSSCALTISKFLEKKGMRNIYVDFSSGMVKFVPSPGYDSAEVSKGIQSLGYSVSGEQQKKKLQVKWLQSLESKFYVSLVFTIPLLLHMILPFWLLHNPFVQFFLCLPVLIIGISHFGRSAWGSIRNGTPNMDVLIFIGSTAAFIYSCVGAFILTDPDYLFFETSASIITLVLLGNLIEHRSVKRTRSAISELSRLQPQMARRIDFFGNEKLEVISEIDQREVRKGDYLLVRNGDQVPADGEIAWGNGWVDESMISGESMPVEKSIGSTAIAGTILKEGTLKMRATAVGKETALSRIIEMVSNAQRNKPVIQKLADKITAVFVPVVLTISALTLVAGYFLFDLSFSRALMNSIGVLVISCPCAMGLATPTAVMVGIGRAAKKGILVKGAQSLETLASVKTIVFDKTGTLTTGLFRITRLKAIALSEAELKNILVSVESFSSHPIAKSIVAVLPDAQTFPLTSVAEKKGHSIQGKDVSGNQYEVGSFLIASHLSSDDSYNVYVLKNGTLAGMVLVQDELRPESAEVIQYLKRSGIRTILLSGDREEICKAIATELQVDEYYSQKLSEEKLSIITELTTRSPVAMVGDGVNDAPALTAATIGISLSNASRVAIDSSQVILLRGDLRLLPEALNISVHTLRTIRQNLFWAFFYNVIAIPVAAFGFLKPMVAALSMAFSDVMVIGNSLRLRTKKLS